MEVAKLSLSVRDLYLFDIEDQINSRRQLILDKGKALHKKQKVNKFLEDVKNDYKKYYDYIITEKQQQYNSMQTIQSYLEDLIKTEKIANHEMKTAKYDQKQILTEMDKIKIELDKLLKV